MFRFSAEEALGLPIACVLVVGVFYAVDWLRSLGVI